MKTSESQPKMSPIRKAVAAFAIAVTASSVGAKPVEAIIHHKVEQHKIDSDFHEPGLFEKYKHDTVPAELGGLAVDRVNYDGNMPVSEFAKQFNSGNDVLPLQTEIYDQTGGEAGIAVVPKTDVNEPQLAAMPGQHPDGIPGVNPVK